MYKNLLRFIFTIGFIVGIINFISVDQQFIELLPKSTQSVPIVKDAFLQINDNVFLTLGFGIFYSLISGVASCAGGYLFIYICKTFHWTKNKLFNLLDPTFKDEKHSNI